MNGAVANRMNWHGLRAAFALRYNVMPLHVLPKQPTAQRAADFRRLSCSPRLGVRQPGYSFHATAYDGSAGRFEGASSGGVLAAP
jgi:hypothetical protein